MRQRWNDLLFAHWPVPAGELAKRLPDGLEVDTFGGEGWLGVVPFRMDRVQARIPGRRGTAAGAIGMLGARAFPELNLRTYVRSRRTGRPGVWFFSLDAGSPLAVLGARLLFSLPYFPARMRCELGPNEEVRYASRRLWPRGRPAETWLRYRPTGPVEWSEPGTLGAFLTERYCLFTVSRWTGRLMVGEIHHRPWPLQPAEAEWERNGLPADFGFALPPQPPVLHFARELPVVVWALRPEAETGP